MAESNPELESRPKSTPADINVFTPKSEWKEEDRALVLRVYLPGFTEKQISYQVVKPWRYIKVSGDPSTVYFDITFDNIPEKYNLDELKTQFSGGMFIVRIPKVAADEQTASQEKESTKSQDQTPKPEETAREPKPEKVVEEKPSESQGWNMWMLISVIIAIGTCIAYNVVEQSRKKN